MRVGIAGVDENKRVTQARLAIAGEAKGRTLAGARFGMGGLNDRHIISAGQEATFGISGLDQAAKTEVARCAVAGPNTRPIVESARSAIGIAGNTNARAQLVDVTALKARDEALSRISAGSNRLGDRVARNAWRTAAWFADFPYLVRKDIHWRSGRDLVFGRPYRELPLIIDSSGYRREITSTAPRWAHDFDVYPRVIELVDPDGYVAYDYPQSRARTIDALRALMAIFPNDERLWPVFSIRWTWDDKAYLSFAKAPGWVSGELGRFIPVTRTQRPFKWETRERWARQAIANAIVIAEDRDFRWMAETFGQVMIGGMVKGPCPRMARHLFAATLVTIYPDVHFWLLGQANFAVVNGLGMMGYLDRTSCDGSWWIKDATADRFAVVENNLITMLSLEGKATSFFTLIELMAANLRSLLGAYAGEIEWPKMEMPIDLADLHQKRELREHYQAAQLELGLWQEE
jgi:hypothetical protein